MKSHRFPFVLLALAIWCLPLAASAGDVKGALSYVPSDSMAVAGADVDRLRSSPLFPQVVEAIIQESRARKELAELIAKTGFDPRRDIHSVVAAFPPEFPRNDDEFVLVIEAKVNERRAIAFAKKQGGKIQRKNSGFGPYYEIDGGDGAVAFRGKYIVIGGKKTFMKALAASRGRSARTQGRLVARLGAVSSHDVFMVADLPPKVRQQMRGSLPGGGEVQAISASLDVRKGLQLHAKATMNSAKTAQRVSGFVKQALDEVRRDPSFKQMGLDRYLAKLSVHAVGRDLETSLVLTRAQTQSLIKLLRTL